MPGQVAESRRRRCRRSCADRSGRRRRGATSRRRSGTGRTRPSDLRRHRARRRPGRRRASARRGPGSTTTSAPDGRRTRRSRRAGRRRHPSVRTERQPARGTVRGPSREVVDGQERALRVPPDEGEQRGVARDRRSRAGRPRGAAARAGAPRSRRRRSREDPALDGPRVDRRRAAAAQSIGGRWSQRLSAAWSGIGLEAVVVAQADLVAHVQERDPVPGHDQRVAEADPVDRVRRCASGSAASRAASSPARLANVPLIAAVAGLRDVLEQRAAGERSRGTRPSRTSTGTCGATRPSQPTAAASSSVIAQPMSSWQRM